MGGVVRHNFGEIWRGIRANLPLLRGGYCGGIVGIAMLIFRPPPLLIIIAQSLIITILDLSVSTKLRVPPFDIVHMPKMLQCLSDLSACCPTLQEKRKTMRITYLGSTLSKHGS